jgi:hypothetical protein
LQAMLEVGCVDQDGLFLPIDLDEDAVKII